MYNEKNENKSINENEEIIDKDLINSGNKKIPISLELIQKIDLKFVINKNIFSVDANLRKFMNYQMEI